MVSKNEHAIRSDCPLACALDLVGDHWTLLIVRDMLLFNMHEYKEFLAGDEGISSNILSDRLAKLEQHGLVNVIPHPQSKKRKLYYLTHMGKDLIHVLFAIGQWSRKHLGYQGSLPEEFRHYNNAADLAAALLARLDEWERSFGINAKPANS